MKKGMILVTKDPFVMSSGVNALVVGKEYRALDVYEELDRIYIQSEVSNFHLFHFEEIEKYFDILENDPFQELFSFMLQTHGIILTQDEMWEIVAQVEKLQEKLKV
jgi:hypothetical protein